MATDLARLKRGLKDVISFFKVGAIKETTEQTRESIQ